MVKSDTIVMVAAIAAGVYVFHRSASGIGGVGSDLGGFVGGIVNFGGNIVNDTLAIPGDIVHSITGWRSPSGRTDDGGWF